MNQKFILGIVFLIVFGLSINTAEGANDSLFDSILESIGDFFENLRSDQRTPQEKIYWEKIQSIKREGYSKFEDDNIDPRQSEALKTYMLRTANFFESVPKIYLQEISMLKPPPLFVEYHRQSISEWKSLSALGGGFSQLFRANAGRHLSIFKKEFDVLDKQWKAAISTHHIVIGNEIKK